MQPLEAVQVILAGREAARRVGMNFVIDDFKLKNLGLTSEQIREIRLCVFEIEAFVSKRLERLNANPS